jgi:hypothetical protein
MTKGYKMKYVRKIQNHYKVVAGPGAGVTLEIECSIAWELKGNKVVFKPTEADVTFHSYYDTKSSHDYGSGLKIQIESITDKNDIEEFTYRQGNSGSLSITKKTELYDSEGIGRKLVLSQGWSRSSQEVGDTFDFQILVDPDYNIYVYGTATFLDAGVDAWNDLDYHVHTYGP